MPELTVVDTSPIFYLHRIGHLDVLHELYGRIAIPKAVEKELEEGHIHGEDVPQLANYPWIEIINVSTPEYLNLIVDLGPGESEVLAVASYNPLVLVVLDDKLARRIAVMQGFRLTGTAGVLLRAKDRGFITALKPVIEKLLSLDFRLKPELVKVILELAGE